MINGRPTTSIVNLTQDLGRLLQPKDGEMIAIDFLDESVKHQRTIYDVLELDRSTQGVIVHGSSDIKLNEPTTRHNYLNGLFRPEIADVLQKYENQLISELHYNPDEVDPYDNRRMQYLRNQAAELAKQSRKWEVVLAKEGLAADQPDHFMAASYSRKIEMVDEDAPEDGYSLDMIPERHYGITPPYIWDVFEHGNVVVPPLPMSNEQIEATHPRSDRQEIRDNPEIVLFSNINVLRSAMNEALSNMTEREATVLRERFGLDDDHIKTLNEVGSTYGITGQRVRQIESEALAKLRHPQSGQTLRDYIDDTFYQEPIRSLVLPVAGVSNAIERIRKLSSEEEKNDSLAEVEVSEEEFDAAQSALRIEQNRRLMTERDAYVKELSDLVKTKHVDQDGNLDSYDAILNHKKDLYSIRFIVDNVARRFGYNEHDFKGQHLVLEKLLETNQQYFLINSAQFFTRKRNLKSQGHYHLSEFEEGLSYETVRDQINTLYNRLSEAILKEHRRKQNMANQRASY